jgi:hypothetical protein
MERIVTWLAVLGVGFALFAVWRNAHGQVARVTASWTATPGVLNPEVSQETIGQTICVRGWTRTVRPPTEYTSQLKVEQLRASGRPGGPDDYQEDHLISLELGGHPTDPRNLWPEPHPRAEQVDRIENELNRKVCSGELTLAEAQRRESALKHRAG